MGASYVVSTDFVAHDLYTQRVKGMEATTRRFAKDAKAQLRTVGDVFKGSFLGGMASNVVASGLSKIAGSFRGAVTAYVGYEEALARAAMKFPEAAERGSAGFKALERGAKAMGATGEFSSQQAAEAYQAMAAAGLNAAQAVSALPPISEFAEASNLGLADATDITAKSMRLFGVEASKATLIGDRYLQTASSSRIPVEELYGAVQTGGAAFAASGQSLESFLSLVGYLGQKGIPASRSAMALSGAMLKLSSPKNAGALKRLGVATTEIVDGKRKFRDVVDIIGDLQTKFSGLNDAAKRKALEKLFDARSIRVIAPLFNEASDGLQKYAATIENSGGKAKKMNAVIDATIADKLERISVVGQEKGMEIIEKMFGGGGIDNVLSAIQRFDVGPIVTGARALGRLVGFLADHAAAILSLAKSFLIIKGALMLRQGATSLLGAVGGMAGGAPALAAAAAGAGGGLGGMTRQAAAGASRAPGFVMVGGTGPTRSTWNGRTVVGPSQGAMPMRFEMPETKAKLTGTQIAGGIMSGVQALGVGVAIGTSISDVLYRAADDMQSRINNDIRRWDALRAGTDEAAKTSGGTAKQAARIKRALQYSQDQYSGVGGKIDMGLGFLSAAFTGGDNPLDQLRQNSQSAKTAITELVNARKNQEVKVTVELTGSASGSATVKGVETNGSKTGPSAPSVNKSKAGRQ